MDSITKIYANALHQETLDLTAEEKYLVHKWFFGSLAGKMYDEAFENKKVYNAIHNLISQGMG